MKHVPPLHTPEPVDGLSPHGNIEAQHPEIIDLEAFCEIYARFWRRVTVMMQRDLGVLDAEDAMQEVFLRVWSKREAFDPGRFTVWAWLYGIARHVALDIRVQQVQHAKEEQAAQPGIVDPMGAIAEATEIEAWIAKLPSTTRGMVILHFGLGYTYREVGERLGLPETMVAKRIERVRKALLKSTVER